MLDFEIFSCVYDSSKKKFLFEFQKKKKKWNLNLVTKLSVKLLYDYLWSKRYSILRCFENMLLFLGGGGGWFCESLPMSFVEPFAHIGKELWFF